RYPFIERKIFEETASEHAGAGEQHQRRGELGDHEQAGEFAAAPRARATDAILESVIQVDARRAERWSETEQQAAQDTERGEVCEHAVIHRKVNPIRAADV